MKAVFAGCSFTVGSGFPVHLRDTYIYDRLVSNHFKFDRINIGVEGASNYKIFMGVAQALCYDQIDIVFVQWSALNRIWLSPEPGVSYTILNNKQIIDSRFKPEFLKKFSDTLKVLNHDFQNIIDLIDYCSIIDNLAQHTSTKVVYINGMVPWTKEISNPIDEDLSNFLSDYTKEVLNFNTSTDDRIIKNFKVLHEKFLNLDCNKWVNLFEPFQKNSIDTGPEGHHPGVNSHAWLASQIINHINKRELIT